MKILIIGGSGVIGRAVHETLKDNHEILIAGPHQSQYAVDMTSTESIQQLFQNTGELDAMVITAGKTHFEPITKFDTAGYQFGLNNKLMGQIRIVLEGMAYLKSHGSFTLTSGVINRDPIYGGTSAAMVNGAIDSFVQSAALELPNSIRINAVSPTVIEEAWDRYGGYFPGFEPVPVKKVALAYRKSVEGIQTGRVFYVEP